MDEVTARQNLDPRVSRLESQIETLVRNVEHLTQKLDHLADALVIKKKPDWQAIFTGLSVLVFILMSIGAAILLPINQRMNYMEGEEREHRASSGHLKSLISHARHDEKIINTENLITELRNDLPLLKANLEKEMLLNNTRLQTEMKGVDSSIQKEMTLIFERHADRLDRLEALSKEITEVHHNFSALIATAITKIEAIDEKTHDRWTKNDALEVHKIFDDRLNRLENIIIAEKQNHVRQN